MNINSHVQLPNCVLRNFRDETDPEKKVWYLDVQTGDILRKSSKKLGTCKGYYSETGERFWAENIENPLSIITHRIQKYCTGEIPCLQISADDADACKRYIKAAFIRSKMAEDEMNKHSVTASICTEQSNHDMLACFGLRSYGPIESDLEKMDVSVLVNKTERMLVVPRNCFYLVTLQGASHMVAPVCPKGAYLNESRFSNYFIEKWDLSYPRSLAIWGFPLFHVKAPILQNAPNAKLIFLCMAAI